MFYFENEIFRVTEYSSGFEIESKVSGITCGLGDMVDAYHDKNGRQIMVGTEAFNRAFREDLIASKDEYREAYFPIDLEILNLYDELKSLHSKFSTLNLEKAIEDSDRMAKITRRLLDLTPTPLNIFRVQYA